MQASHSRANQRILKDSLADDKNTLNDTPKSPAGVIDGERLFSGRQVHGDECAVVTPSIGCGCFRFWDFFQGDDEHDVASFSTRLALNDINPVSEEQMYAPNTGLYRKKEMKSPIDDLYQNDTIDEQPLQLQGPENDCKKSTNEDNVHQIILSFSPSTFSEGDNNQYDYEEKECNSEKKVHHEDGMSNESSLSFDETEFDEQDFEGDYGMVDNRNVKIIVDTKGEYLPTIEESSMDSYDVGSNFNKIFHCHR